MKCKTRALFITLLNTSILVLSVAPFSLPSAKQPFYLQESNYPNLISGFSTYTDLHSNTRISINLNGTWQFRLDPKDAGKEESWYKPEESFDQRISVPGTWQSQGYGHQAKKLTEQERKIGSEVPLKTQYLGPAWYKRKISITSKGLGEKVWLKLGAVNPSAEIWINGEYVGNVNQPGVPTRFDITSKVRFDTQNDITIRVYEENRGLGNWYNLVAQWSGLWRDVSLEITKNTWVDDLWIIPDVDRSRALIVATVAS